MSSWLLPVVFFSAGMSLIDNRGKSVNLSISHEGYDRTFQLYMPAESVEDAGAPLLVVLHSGGGSAKGILRLTQGRFNKIADEEGGMVVYPEAVRRYWNEGRRLPLSYAHRNNIDDAGFLRAMIKSLIEEYAVDPNRIFVAGYANGGQMAIRMACEAPDLIAGVAVVNASMPQDIVPACRKLFGTSLMLVNGTEDPILPYEGGMMTYMGIEQGQMLSTDETVAFWLQRNECPGHARRNMLLDRDPKDETTVTSYLYPGCKNDARVKLFRIEGGGHVWPGGRSSQREDRVGRMSRDINACDEIWTFISQIGL